MLQTTDTFLEEKLSFEKFKTEVLTDYRFACISREVSLLGRKEVLTGKAKFGIFGDGKEVAQVAASKFFKKGDFRAGYYRDQTFMFASGICDVDNYFSQLYSDPNIDNDIFSAGRQMNAHFVTKNVGENGEWLDIANQKNTSSDMAPTAAQMPRALGLALASKLFRHVDVLKEYKNLSINGNEVCFCTIGDASTSEGHFWETVNAAGVLQVPLAIFVWDDGYGISVPKKMQTTKSSISTALSGMQKTPETNGIDIYKIKGWDYAGMCEVFEPAIQKIRETHIPALFHVEEITQPQGHSTSGSHERYKSAERLAWEKEWDCIKQMKIWIVENNLATLKELNLLEEEVKEYVKNGKQKAWDNYITPIKDLVSKSTDLITKLNIDDVELKNDIRQLILNREPNRKDVMKLLFKAIETPEGKSNLALKIFYNDLKKINANLYNTHLYNEGSKSAINITPIKPFYKDDKVVNGYEVLNQYFDELFATNKKVLAFGEDLGFIGDVNQGFNGLQAKYGEGRIFDTSIRELTIIGQGIGLALRGLRPIAEIQYLDYLLYGLQPLSDDLCTTHFRTAGQQSCPLIVRTRGHRLEGIWHSGSPLGMIINSLRGMFICVPRNMVQAVGMYNTLLQGNDPGLIIECLNGYRLKERLPSNLLACNVALGVPEILKEGTDITMVSYGSTLRIVTEAADRLEKNQISCEVIDVQTLLPFDINHIIVESLKKTNRIIFIDEDVPGGASAFMFNKVIEEQGGFKYLDVAPKTITAKAHRPSYGSDGDYFSKPNAEEIIIVVKDLMKE